jgi:hypothetical protein
VHTYLAVLALVFRSGAMVVNRGRERSRERVASFPSRAASLLMSPSADIASLDDLLTQAVAALEDCPIADLDSYSPATQNRLGNIKSSAERIHSGIKRALGEAEEEPIVVKPPARKRARKEGGRGGRQSAQVKARTKLASGSRPAHSPSGRRIPRVQPEGDEEPEPDAMEQRLAEIMDASRTPVSDRELANACYVLPHREVDREEDEIRALQYVLSGVEATDEDPTERWVRVMHDRGLSDMLCRANCSNARESRGQ